MAKKMSKFEEDRIKRREKLGMIDSDREYDLDMALAANTDDTISKIVAGSFIVSMLALLFVAIILPSLSDVEGACRPLLSGGRC
mmetsp:Transcript_3930/g.5843  ORF Transcript_3930/g.5843 Transcript_3930/m.5843 type:complete len:84 (+) Transcript_3930:359-610(+)